MSKKLLDILPTLQTFQDNVISQLTNMFNGVEWLNDTTSYTKQETIYKLLILKYGDRQIRYDDENIFLNRLVFDLADFLPDIYAKQQVFIKNKLNEFLSDNKNRAVVIDNTATNTRNTDNNTKFGNSSSPLNLVISNANEITNAPITSLNLSNVKLLENYNGTNQQVNYNFVNDLIKTLNNDYSLRLNEFMELLGKHFISVVGGYYRNSNDIQTVKDEPYRFNNGYLVNEVDYLCSDNKEEINRFNEKLGRLSDQVATKQNQLTAGSNISINNNVISANIPQTDLSNYVQKNGDLQVVNAYIDFYGNIVAKNNGYVDNVDTQAPTSMVNIRHLNTTVGTINTNIANNTTEIARVDRVVATNTTNISNLDNRATNLESNYTTLNNGVVKLEGSQTISGTKTFNNQIVANEGLTTAATKPITSGNLELGYGDSTAYITPEDTTNKKLKFSGRSGRGRFDIDLESQSQLMGVKDPTRPLHAVNKNYVDNSINNLRTQVVLLSSTQDITGRKTFTSAGEPIQIKETGTNSGYITGYTDNTKKWALGNNGTDGDVKLQSINGNVILAPGASGNINCSNKKIYNVAEPTATNDAATKQYVDNYINYKEETVTINVGAQNQINPTQGYKVIDVKVARKRSEGYWFFDYHTTLNIQLFIHTNGKYTIYNNGNVSGFTNDFKIFITEKKV